MSRNLRIAPLLNDMVNRLVLCRRLFK